MREQQLVTTFVELTDVPVEEFDIVELLTRLTDRCVDVLDVAAAGIMLAGVDGELRVVASTSDAMHALERFELQSAEGPCQDCFRTGLAITNEQLRPTDTRWPGFTPRALAAGFVSVSALPLRLRGRTIGSLNLFRTDAGVLHELDLAAAQAFADVATIGILQHRAAEEAHVVNQQLTFALNSRIVIEQAKGMIAERTGLDVEDAFARLRNHARAHNLRLVDLAASIIDGSVSPASLR